MRVLLIEPDAIVAGALTREMAKANIRCEVAGDAEADRLAHDGGDLQDYDAILVGRVRDSREQIAQMRRQAADPIIVSLLEHRDVASTIEHLRAGADDVLVKPINGKEIEARMQAVRRRAHGHSSSELHVGRLTVYLDGRDPAVDGKRLHLSHREHAIFSVLALNVGRVVSKERIYEAVYGLSGSEPLDKVIDVYICKLRKKLSEATGGEKYIETVYGRGYKFEAPVEDDTGGPTVPPAHRIAAATAGIGAEALA